MSTVAMQPRLTRCCAVALSCGRPHSRRRVLTGLNTHWRLSKYYPGDQFHSHVDAAYHQDDTHRSMYTVNICEDSFSPLSWWCDEAW